MGANKKYFRFGIVITVFVLIDLLAPPPLCLLALAIHKERERTASQSIKIDRYLRTDLFTLRKLSICFKAQLNSNLAPYSIVVSCHITTTECCLSSSECGYMH